MPRKLDPISIILESGGAETSSTAAPLKPLVKTMSVRRLAEDEILRPMTKKQMWEVKEKYTTIEVKLQYVVIKLEEKMEEMQSKIESLRIENSKLSDIIKNKYGEVRAIYHLKYVETSSDQK